MAQRTERGPAALSPLRTVALAIGFVCAVAASVTIFVTENAAYLRIGIVVALWGFVFAALAAGRRQTEQVVAASTEIELRKSYELELEREVAARREYELRLESQLRRELQDDFKTEVGALREEMILLRRELSEQWDSELRVERMVMRTQSVRMGGDRPQSLDHDSSGRPSIDAAPAYTGQAYTGPSYPGPADPGSFVADAPEAGPFGAAPAAAAEPDEQRWSEDEGFPANSFDEARAFDEAPADMGPATREVPVIAGLPPTMPTAPVPLLPGARRRTPVQPAPPAPEPAPLYSAPPGSQPDGAAREQILARILAEAGSSTGRRRQKRRSADGDGDGDAVPAQW